MPTKLEEFRTKYAPAYDMLSDKDLSDKIYNKFYTSMPRSDFDKRMGYTPPMSWADVPLEAAGNLPASAQRFASDIVQPIMDPVGTAKNLGRLEMGLAEKVERLRATSPVADWAASTTPGLQIVSGVLRLLGVGGTEAGGKVGPHEKYIDAATKAYADRYFGGVENLKRTIAEDPVGVAADLSALLTGGETLPGRVGTIAGRAGRAVDPLRAVPNLAHYGVEAIGSLGTFTGAEPIRTAARAGYEGGEAGRRFRANLRGQEPMEEAALAARQGVDEMRRRRGVEYRAGTQAVFQDPTVLDFNRIDQAVDQATGVKTFAGRSGTGPRISISPTTQGIRERMAEAIDMWRQLDPAEFHTVEGLDALKQMLGDIRDGTQYGTPERRVADQIYQAVRGTIIDQAPRYAEVMRDYEQASGLIREIESELTGQNRGRIGPALRKLQSIMRDNVYTSWGHRRQLADELIAAGAPQLMERLAGQALQPWFPRGLGRLAQNLSLEVGGLTGAHVAAAGGVAGLAGAAHSLPVLALQAPFMSPRIVGEVAHAGGRAAGALRAGAWAPYLQPAARGAYWGGRAEEPLQQGPLSQ